MFIAEKISGTATLGIIITIAGAILIKINTLSLREVKKIFQFHREYLGARFAITASLMYSFGAVFDKSKISSFPITLYLTIILTCMYFNMATYYVFWKKEPVLQQLMVRWKSALIGGLTLYFSFLFFRIALREVFVSIAVPVRQLSIIFAMIFGIVLLKEPFKTGKFIGAVVIMLGIVLINL